MTEQTFTLTIPAATEYVDRALATASWWDRYTILPGTYPVEFTTIDGYPVPADSPRAYDVRAKVDAVLTETYRVNRVFTASSSEHRQVAERTTVTWRTYSYNVWDADHAPHGGTIACSDPAAESARMRAKAAVHAAMEVERPWTSTYSDAPSVKYGKQADRLAALAVTVPA